MDLSRSDMFGEIRDHRRRLSSDQRHISGVGLFGALPDHAFVGAYGLPDHAAYLNHWAGHTARSAMLSQSPLSGLRQPPLV
jgi:hypothetical protein